MGRGRRADCSCKWPSETDFSYESREFFHQPCARCEERSIRSPVQCETGGVQQKSKTSSSEKVPLKSLNETVVVSPVQEAPSNRTRGSADKAGKKRRVESARRDRRGCDIAMPSSSSSSSRKDSIQEHLTPFLKFVADDEEVTTSPTSACASCLKSLMIALRGMCWSGKKRRNAVFVKTKTKQGKVDKVTSREWGSSSGEGTFTAINFFIKHEEWQCMGFDLISGTWRRLPTISCLPTPDPSLFKEYSICGNGGLLCANVSKSAHKEQLVVFNLLTGERRDLPPLHYLRNPVLLHILVSPVTNAYKVIAAGSSNLSSSGDEELHLSKRMEVFDSRTSQWRVVSDLPGPEFGLNEHQAGVCVDGILYFVTFLDCDGRRGIVAFDVENGAWLEDRTCYVPFSLYSNIFQLVESDGKVCLFSEQERDGVVEHCVDVVEFFSAGSEPQLKTVVRVKKSGGRGLLVFPEYMCVPYGKGRVCIFNSIKRDGLVYDIEKGMQSDVLQPPPESQRGDNFFSLNPLSFTLQPNFASKP